MLHLSGSTLSRSDTPTLLVLPVPLRLEPKKVNFVFAGGSTAFCSITT